MNRGTLLRRRDAIGGELADLRERAESGDTTLRVEQIDALTAERAQIDRDLDALDDAERRQSEQNRTGATLEVRAADGRTSAAAPLAGPGDWLDDRGRKAALSRGEAFGGHQAVREHAGRFAQRDQAVVGQHGSFGQLVRSMSTTSGSAVVPTVWATDIIDRARNIAAVTRAGARIVPMDAKVVQIGRLTTDPTAAFRAEGSTITASDPVFDNVTLTATTMSALVVGSIEWFQDAADVDQVVSEAIAKAIALQLDLVSLFGGLTTGNEGFNLAQPPNPRGILATLLAVASSSVLGGQTNGTTQTALTFWNEVLDTIYTPRDFNETPNALLWNSKLARMYAKAYDSTGQPLEDPSDITAIPQFITNQIPSFTAGTMTSVATDLFVGDFTELLIGQRLDLQVQTLTERYAELGQVGIVANWRGDVQLARPRAFSVYRYLKGS
jgi:HK97 family phage major capsid protein